MSDEKVKNIILMPFENGKVAQVTLSLYAAPRGQHRPVDAYVVTECEGNFTGSARRAAEAVYSLARKRLPKIRPMVVGFDVQGVSSECSPVTGESGGLAFAVALAGVLFKQSRPVAATGVIASSEGAGEVTPVRGTAEKLLAAAKALPDNGRILYPKPNHGQIPEEVFAMARQKNLTLHPVSSVADAVYEAYDIRTQPRDKFGLTSRTKWIAAGIAAIAVVIILIALLAAGTRHKTGKAPGVQKPAATIPGPGLLNKEKKEKPADKPLPHPALPDTGFE